MFIKCRVRQFLGVVVGAVVFTVAAAAQLPQGLYVNSAPTGLQPLGIDVLYSTLPNGASAGYADAFVANSGENSVSTLIIGRSTITNTGKITGIPSPYDVAACPAVRGQVNLPQQYVLVTSPSDNSVQLLQFPNEGIGTMRTLKVGPQPHSIACFVDFPTNKLVGVVSNVGDNTLVVFDVASLTVMATIPNVPASRGFHGIQAFSDAVSQRGTALVAGTDANVVTLVDLANSRVLIQIPVARPTAIVGLSSAGGTSVVASAGDNEILVFSSAYILTSTYKNLPNPQDVADSAFGLFATGGSQDSLSYWEEGKFGTMPTIIAGFPNAAALAASTFSIAPTLTGQPVSSRDPGGTFRSVLVTSTSSNSVFMITNVPPPPPPPLPSEFSISNAASFANSQISPGSLASINGATGVSQSFPTSPSVPPPTTLGGVTLTIGGSLTLDSPINKWTYSSTGAIQAPLLFVGPNQINLQIPPGITPGTAIPAQLTRPGGSTSLTTLNITATAPGIFTVLQNGQGQGAVQNIDFSQNGDPQSILGAKPAALGSQIEIYATGAGDTNPPLLPGQSADPSGSPLVLTNVQPTVTIGGQPAQVLFSGMAPGFVGLCQINVLIPQSVTPGNAVPLVVNAGGVASNTVTIAVQ